MIRFTLRILTDIAIIIVIIHGWWYLAILLGLLGIWNFRYYVEIILVGLFYDSLFGITSISGIIGHIGLIISVVLFFVLSGMKRMVRIKE